MIRRITLLSLVFVLASCGNSLPKQRDEVRSKWSTFEEAKSSYDQIQTNQTTVNELKVLGFDPFTYPNIRILTYLDIVDKFIPNPSIKFEDLDSGIQQCIQAKKNCFAYQIAPSVKQSKRLGNPALDVMNFREITETRGWEFNALVVLIDDTVVYKIWGGQPSVEIYRDKDQPWGPVQVLKDMLGGD